jgi:hypothetical protein
MKYFTGERYIALQDFTNDAALDGADAAWEEAVAHYDAYLQHVLPILPPEVRQFVEEYYLHDAAILSMGRQGDDFVMVVQPDEPPHSLLTLRFILAGDPTIDREALPPQFRSPSPQWLHEEIEVVGEGVGRHFRLSILLDNGWEITLPIHDLQIRTLDALFPTPPNGESPMSTVGSRQASAVGGPRARTG